VGDSFLLVENFNPVCCFFKGRVASPSLHSLDRALVGIGNREKLDYDDCDNEITVRRQHRRCIFTFKLWIPHFCPFCGFELGPVNGEGDKAGGSSL
jgi:hypothetical protein